MDVLNTDVKKTAEVLDRSNLTKSQFAIWLGQKLNPETPLYNMAVAFTIKGKIDPLLFRRAFHALVERCETLRMVIRESGGAPQQIILPEIPYRLDFLDFSKEYDAQSEFRKWSEKRAQICFDLSERLFDAALVKIAAEEFTWYLNQHHLITDGVSTALLYRRMAEFYELARAGRVSAAKALPAYRNFVAFEKEHCQSLQGQASQRYWMEKTQNSPEPLQLYGKHPAENSTRTERVCLNLGAKRTEQLKAIAWEEGIRTLFQDISLFNIFATLLFAYLYRVSGNQKLVIGSPAHNRSTAEFKETIGLFIELFPLHIQLEAGETFLSLIKKVTEETFGFLRHAQPGASTPENNTFQVVLNFINAAFSGFNGLPMQSRWIHPGHGDRGHALRLQVHDLDRSGSFQLHFDFNNEVFDETQRKLAAQHFLRVVDAFIASRRQPIDQFSLLTDEEEEQLLLKYNRTDITYPAEQTFLRLFEKQVAAMPEAIAVECRSETLTYYELNRKANRLAHYLKKQGVSTKSIVAICAERSIELVTAILGVLKSGAAFVPIDAQFPAERINYILEDTQSPILLTQSSIVNRQLPIFNFQSSIFNQKCVCLDSDWQTIENESAENLNEKPLPNALAYLIYTSGSTGNPKGVMIEHRSLANYLAWAKKIYFGGGARREAIPSLGLDFSFFSSISADLTVTSVFLPLISGSTIIVYPEDRDGVDISILKVIEENKAGIIKLTPSHLSLIADGESHSFPGSKALRASGIKKIIVGGEDFRADLAQRVYAIFGGNIEIYNEYGPTEATVGCMIYRFDPEKDISGSLPIGKPADNMQIYLLDRRFNPVPVGVEGEMYIGGVGLARGYYNRPELTAERFIANPFKPLEKMYVTGDIARWKAPGVMEFLGRRDDQVKIRGFRIELGEVENALLAHPVIRECVARVVHIQSPENDKEIRYCKTCGLASNHPQASLDEEEICQICREYEQQREKAQFYFKSKTELRKIFEKAKACKTGKYDCLMLYSGGKDSTYVLYQLVEMGLHPLVFSLENGYISSQAKANIRRVTDDLGLDLIWDGPQPADMNKIFVDSLQRFSNVCNGCFKTIYTLGVKLAKENGIKYIVTGLSRGQFFETRMAEFFKNKIFDSGDIDRHIIEARKAYHRMDDAVSRCLDVRVFQNDAVFEEIQFVDFFRYSDVKLEEIYDFLHKRAPWIRPGDTGRSTNCLINEAGIYIHKKERGFHNYALPYSWDVRLGHKERRAALEELDDAIDEARVRKMLREIGYDESERERRQSEKRLAAYYVADRELNAADLRAFLSTKLPAYMIPSYFIRLEKIPLTASGKTDRQALPAPEKTRVGMAAAYAAPGNRVENILAQIWSEVLGIERLGVHDNFFDLGGDSILNIQIISRANQAGLQITPGQLFRYPTVAELAAVAGTDVAMQTEQGIVSGDVPLTPIQQWFFEQNLPEPRHWNMSLEIELKQDIDPVLLEKALQQLVLHHDALRLRFIKENGRWRQFIDGAEKTGKMLNCIHLSELDVAAQEAVLEKKRAQAQASLDMETGPLLKAVLFQLGANRPDRLLIVVHHLAMDGISWRILLEDLYSVYRQLSENKTVQLPPKTVSFKRWAEKLVEFAGSEVLKAEAEFWMKAIPANSVNIPLDYSAMDDNTEASAATCTIELNEQESADLLQKMPSAYHTGVQELLLAALAQTLTQWSGQNRVVLNLEGHGREDTIEKTNVSRTVGWFTSIFPAVFFIKENAAPAEVVNAIKEQLRRIPHRGIGFGILRYLSEETDFRANLKNLPQPQVLFNYLGQLDQLIPESTLFSKQSAALEGSHSSKGKRHHLLDIHGFVANGRLRVWWVYSQNLHQPNTIKKLAETFLSHLRALIAFGLSPEAAEISPADFPLAKLNEKKLKKLSQILEKI